jgi:hypothetical protein
MSSFPFPPLSLSSCYAFLLSVPSFLPFLLTSLTSNRLKEAEVQEEAKRSLEEEKKRKKEQKREEKERGKKGARNTESSSSSGFEP